MAIPPLAPVGGQVPVQTTTFSIDALGRYICSTWDEVTANGGAPFDAVVVGAAMYGAYCAAKIFRRQPGKRVLLLDAGRFMVPSMCRTSRGSASMSPARSTPPAIPAWRESLCGVCPGAATFNFPGWHTARVANPFTGVAGVRALHREISPLGPRRSEPTSMQTTRR